MAGKKLSKADEILGRSETVPVQRVTCGECVDGFRRVIERVTTWFDGRKWPETLEWQYPLPPDEEFEDRIVRYYDSVEACGCQGE